MGTEKESRLLFKMAVPVALSMLVQALYNIVDSAFVGQISEDALSAVSVVFPFQTLFAALNVGIGVGMSQLISLSMGSRQQEKAKLAAGQGLFLSLCCTAFFVIFGLTGSRLFFRISGITGQIADLGQDYLKIITVFSLGIFCESVFERMLMSTGKTGCTMACQITGAVLNIVLDPILIFGCGFIPPMGVAGAAAATVFSQHIAALLAFLLHKKNNPALQFKIADIKPHAESIKVIFSVGASAAIKQGAAAIVLMIVNGILIRFSTAATAVYGAFNRLYVFFLTPSWAIQDVLVILAAYNLGIGSRRRIKRLFWLSIAAALAITFIGCAVIALFPVPLLRIFGGKEAMLDLGKTALPILACFLPFQAAASTVSAMLQGLGDGGGALKAGLIERFLLPVALVLLASMTRNLSLVWWSFTAAEILGLGISVIFLSSTFRRKVSVLSE